MVEIKARTPINEGRYSLKELAADPHNVGTSAQRNPVEVDSRGASAAPPASRTCPGSLMVRQTYRPLPGGRLPRTVSR